jgi:hypothetical protein
MRDGMAMYTACFHAGFLFGLFFDPEDGGDMLLQNVVYFQWTILCYIQKTEFFKYTTASLLEATQHISSSNLPSTGRCLIFLTTNQFWLSAMFRTA